MHKRDNQLPYCRIDFGPNVTIVVVLLLTHFKPEMAIGHRPVDAAGQVGPPIYLTVDEDALKMFVFILGLKINNFGNS